MIIIYKENICIIIKKKNVSGIHFNCLLTVWLYGFYNFRHFYTHMKEKDRLFIVLSSHILPVFKFAHFLLGRINIVIVRAIYISLKPSAAIG